MGDRTLPLFALNTVLVPGAPLPLHIFEQRYRRMVADLLAGEEREFVVLLIKHGDEVLESPSPGLTGPPGRSPAPPAPPAPPVTYEVGTIAYIDQAQQLPDGRSLLVCTGHERVRLLKRTQTEPYPMGRFVSHSDDATRQSGETQAVVERVRLSVHRVLEALRAVLPPHQAEQRAALDRAIHSIPLGAEELSYFVARTLFTANNEEKQRLLEAPDPLARLTLALPLILLEERLATQGTNPNSTRGSLN